MAKRSWKTLLTELDKLQGISGETAWKRVTIAVQVYDNPLFQAEAAFGDETKALDLLDGKFQDFLLFAADRQSPFLKLRKILEVFPNLEDWKDGDLHGLYQKVAEMGKADDDEKPVRVTERITKADHQEVCDDRDHYKSRCEYLEGRVSELEIATGEQRQKIATLMGRIEQLEKQSVAA